MEGSTSETEPYSEHPMSLVVLEKWSSHIFEQKIKMAAIIDIGENKIISVCTPRRIFIQNKSIQSLKESICTYISNFVKIRLSFDGKRGLRMTSCPPF